MKLADKHRWFTVNSEIADILQDELDSGIWEDEDAVDFKSISEGVYAEGVIDDALDAARKYRKTLPESERFKPLWVSCHALAGCEKPEDDGVFYYVFASRRAQLVAECIEEDGDKEKPVFIHRLGTVDPIAEGPAN